MSISSWRTLLLRIGDKSPEYGPSSDFKDHIETCFGVLRRELEHSETEILEFRIDSQSVESCAADSAKIDFTSRIDSNLKLGFVAFESKQFLLTCAEQLPHKIPFYGTLVDISLSLYLS
ncbi:hypothetical protein TSUD_322890 [Trifolium subterraneum]|uniref:Uncharacterized protein n=1 Tax=Trifolium subterraneum TaxID=3900 RepID=A0A2Z6LYE7_TRISU|nr:hypothetical protein TSUD_322890 [Trifolium subterraneum]